MKEELKKKFNRRFKKSIKMSLFLKRGIARKNFDLRIRVKSNLRNFLFLKEC